MYAEPVPPSLHDYPFGPLIRYWAEKGVGLDPKWGEKVWSDKVIRAEMDATGIVTVPDDGREAGSTIRSWKNGGGFPSGKNWNALRQALIRYIDSEVRADWEKLVQTAWKAAPPNAKSRKALYAPFKQQIDGMHLKARCTRHLGQRAGTASDYQQTIYFGGRRSHGQL